MRSFNLSLSFAASGLEIKMSLLLHGSFPDVSASDIIVVSLEKIFFEIPKSIPLTVTPFRDSLVSKSPGLRCIGAACLTPGKFESFFKSSSSITNPSLSGSLSVI